MPGSLAPNALPPLLDWIKERSALFRGALLNTILRNDTFYFTQLGTFLERADNTARILDVKYYVLLPHNEMVGGEIDSVQWAAILRSVSAHRSYRWVYQDSYKPWRIADYLILNRQMPRSLRSCYDEIVLALVELGHFYGAVDGPQTLAGEILRQLADGDMDTIFQSRPARVPGRFHRPQQPAGQRDFHHLPLHRRRGAMLISVRHVTRYVYAEPVSYTVQSLRLTPAPFAGLRIADWHVRVPGSPSRWSSGTVSATRCSSSRSSAPHSELVIEAGGTVETRTERRGRRPRKGDSPARVPEGDGATRPDAAIRELAAVHRGQGHARRLHALAGAVRDRVEYVAGITDAHTGGGGAGRRQGRVPGPRAHLHRRGAHARHPRALRHGLPVHARPGARRSHAWAESRLSNRWIAFDVSTRRQGRPGAPEAARGRARLPPTPARPTRVRLGGGDEELDTRARGRGSQAPIQ